MSATVTIDVASEPGAWSHHLCDTACMRHCARCGVGGWHPEARSCVTEDCELRPRSAAEVGGELPSPFGSPPIVDLPVHNAGVPAAGDLRP